MEFSGDKAISHDRQTSSHDQQNEELLRDLEEALATWQQAMQQFNNAFEADDIDDAIYMLMAAELRYEGLLRIAKRRHLEVDLQGRLTIGDQGGNAPTIHLSDDRTS